MHAECCSLSSHCFFVAILKWQMAWCNIASIIHPEQSFTFDTTIIRLD
jgi:hypothetical protein